MYKIGEQFFIIGENSKIEKYIITGLYTHTRTNEETKEEEIKTYYVYQKGEVVMTIGENFMYKDLESVKNEGLRLLDQEQEKLEQMRKDILDTKL